MPSNLVFFSVHADDVTRAQRFYSKVFGWRFEAWGPPGFFLVSTGDEQHPGICGSLHQRHELAPGLKMTGYECSIEVDDIDRAAQAITAEGGEILMPKCEIPTVGWVLKFRDPEGNIAGCKQPA